MKNFNKKTAERIMRETDEIQRRIEREHFGIPNMNIAASRHSKSGKTKRQGNAAREIFKNEIQIYMKNEGVNKRNKLSPLYYLRFEDENWHELNQALEDLEYVKIPSNEDRKEYKERMDTRFI